MSETDESDWAGHLPRSRAYRRILVGLGAAGVATFAQLYSPQGLLPTLARGLEVSPAAAALSVSLATLGVAIAVLPWSWVADRLGRLRAMQVAIIASTVLGVLVALAPDLESLLALRLLEGMALGGLPALAVTYLHDEVHAHHTAAAAAAYISGTTVGGAAGRLIAGPLAGLVGWRAALLTVAIVCAVASAVFLRLMPRPQGYRPDRINLRDVAAGITTSLADRGSSPCMPSGHFSWAVSSASTTTSPSDSKDPSSRCPRRSGRSSSLRMPPAPSPRV